MSLIASLLVMTALSVIIRKPLKRVPWIFYIVALFVSIAGLYLTLNAYPNAAIRAFAFSVQKGHLGFSLFAVVMFIGVFDNDSAVRRYFNPVRSNLSIMAAILMVGHFTLYLRNQLALASDMFSLRLNSTVAFIIGLVLVVLLIVLTITSFNAVKRKMRPVAWKRLQKLAYIFFALIYFHLLGFLLIAALNGSPVALINVTVYTALYVLYMVLRIRKALKDKAATKEPSLSSIN